MNLGIHILWTRPDRFIYVGSVPASLNFVHIDGTEVSEEILKELCRSCTPALSMKYYKIKTRSFETKQSAVDFAKQKGFEVVE